MKKGKMFTRREEKKMHAEVKIRKKTMGKEMK